MNKKFVIINVFVIFALGFLIHGIYGWIPSIMTSIFPVNESLYEHIKLIFYSPLIGSTILYFIFKHQGNNINNFLPGLVISTFFNIVIFYLTFLPIYYKNGENLLVTLIIYFITICLSQYLNYIIINQKQYKKGNIVCIIIIIITMIILTYFTYNPLKADFFKDPKEHYYGIKKK